MGWNGVKTVVAGESILIEDHNTYVNENLLYLLEPNQGTSHKTGSYTTTSTSVVDVHADWSKTITTYGEHIHVHFHGLLYNSGANLTSLYLDVDGTDYLILATVNTQTDYRAYVSWDILLVGLSAGSHTFKLQWQVAAGTGTLNGGTAANAEFFVVKA